MNKYSYNNTLKLITKKYTCIDLNTLFSFIITFIYILFNHKQLFFILSDILNVFFL